jgi:uncharacterized protein with FMN-binding domain
MVTGMTRIVMWLMSTITVLVLLFGYNTSTSGPETAIAAQESTPISGSTTESDSTGTDSGAAQSSSSGTTSTKASTVQGDSVDTEWGPVQVQITVSGGEITAVKMLDYPYENQKDQEINSRALPILIQETLDQQSADVDMVSGATVTSNGYRESLQSALDQAGL